MLYCSTVQCENSSLHSMTIFLIEIDEKLSGVATKSVVREKSIGRNSNLPCISHSWYGSNREVVAEKCTILTLIISIGYL